MYNDFVADTTRNVAVEDCVNLGIGGGSIGENVLIVFHASREEKRHVKWQN